MPSQRLFIAITPPEPVRAVVADLFTPLHDVRWTPIEQLHVTLRFLGDVPEENIVALVDRLAAIRVEPFLLPIEGVGAFPPRRAPHVVWVGLGSGHPRLHQLRQRIDDTLLAAAIDVDLRTFHPHITVARCGPAAENGVRQWLRRQRDFVGPPFAVEAFELFASELKSNGAVHRSLAKFPLVKSPP